jgi:hypothetical protein
MTLNLRDAQRCVACGAWVIVRCLFCSALSPHTATACLQCHEIFAGAPQRYEERQRAAQAQGHGGLSASDHRAPPATGTTVHLGPLHTRRRHGHVSRNAVVTLVGRRLSLGSMDIAVDDILEVRDEGSYNGEWDGGCRWVVVRLASDELGFRVKAGEERAWVEALRAGARPA